MDYHVGVADPNCIFCRIIAGNIEASIVHEDADSMAFLDSHPVFPGHVLLCPRRHYETFYDLPADLSGPLFTTGQLLGRAVEAALEADGTFVAINNRVSQTVPHLHIHIIPRRKKDGLRGFFWPRHKYADDATRKSVADAIRCEVRKRLEY